MGNKTSSSDKGASTTKHGTPDKLKAGALDAETQLEGMYIQIINNKDVKDEMRALFKDVRILVVGRSGSGKSTLIRLMVGEKGPRSICTGRAGEQDIVREWRYRDPDLPLIFHDSNGIDVTGANRLNVIREFLDEHQTSQDFKQRIHLVWYVFSAADSRILDDGGLLELLMKYEIPLLLVMTHNDYPGLVQQNVDSGPLDELLGRIKDPSRGKKAFEDMIRLGNSVKVEKDGSLIGRRDVLGLRELTQKTKSMMDKNLHKTWIACQVTDTNAKLELSAQLIVRKKRAEVFMTCAIGAMPVIQQAQLGCMFLVMTRSLAKIWRVPEPLEKALMVEFFMKEGGHKLLSHFFKSIVAAVGLLGSVMVTVLTPGVGSVAIIGVLAASAFAQMKASSTLLMTFALLILGAILYTKSIQSPNGDWDTSLTKEDYMKYTHDFSTSNYAQELKTFIVKYKSSWEGTTRVRFQTRKLKSQLIDFFKKLMRQREGSLYSHLQNGVEDTIGSMSKLDMKNDDEDGDHESKSSVQDQEDSEDFEEEEEDDDDYKDNEYERLV